MNVEIVNQEKDIIEVKVDNVTIAEILREYLNKNGIKFAAWRMDHPSKPVLFKIESSGKTVKKAISDAISSIKKDADKISKLVK